MRLRRQVLIPPPSPHSLPELARELREFGERVLTLPDGEAWEKPPSPVALMMLWHAAAELGFIAEYRRSFEVDGDVVSAAIEALEAPACPRINGRSD